MYNVLIANKQKSLHILANQEQISRLWIILLIKFSDMPLGLRFVQGCVIVSITNEDKCHSS